jgi:CxxC-x17-CxxC domain-containing protein
MPQSEQSRTEVKCTDCGKTATVPFKPTPGKPVYCRECLPRHRAGRTTESGIQNEQTGEKQAWSRRREGWK